MKRKDGSGTTRRGFVTRVAAGGAAAAMAGALSTGCARSGKNSLSLESRIEALEKRLSGAKTSRQSTGCNMPTIITWST